MRTRRFAVAALLALSLALPGGKAAQAVQDRVVSRHGAWAVVRDGRTADGPCFLSLSTTEGPAVLRMDWVPRADGSLFVIFGLRGVALPQPEAPNNRIAFGWLPEAQDAPTRSGALTLAGYRVVQQEPRVTVMHLAIGNPALVRSFVADAAATVRLHLIFLRNHEAALDTRGFPEAWAALKACNPAIGATLP